MSNGKGISSFRDLSESQQSFFLEKGPIPNDRGAVKKFMSSFVSKFGFSLEEGTVIHLLSSAAAKKKKTKPCCNGRYEKPIAKGSMPRIFNGGGRR